MSRFIVTLTDEERESLETLRKQRGLRSHADVVRNLIKFASGSGLPTPERQAEMKATVCARQAEMVTTGYQVPFGPTKLATPKKPR